jgi:hypothetical protein
MSITNIIKSSDFEIEFQLEDENDTVIDVNDLLDITVQLIHVKLHTVIVTYNIADLTIDNTDDTIHVFIEHTENEDAKLGKYLMKVSWVVADANFSSGTKEIKDQAVVIDLIK